MPEKGGPPSFPPSVNLITIYNRISLTSKCNWYITAQFVLVFEPNQSSPGGYTLSTQHFLCLFLDIYLTRWTQYAGTMKLNYSPSSVPCLSTNSVFWLQTISTSHHMFYITYKNFVVVAMKYFLVIIGKSNIMVTIRDGG